MLFPFRVLLLAIGSLLLPSGPIPQSRSDEELTRAWEQLTADGRDEIAEWFRFELQGLRTVQLDLIRWVGLRTRVDRGFWPQTGPKPFFEPGGKRRRVETDPGWAQGLETELAVQDDPRLWRYDFGTRRLIRRGELRDANRVFREALRGRAPDLDYTLAQVTRLLDDGSLLDAHAALSHAYSNDRGEVFPSVSLYDALAGDDDLKLSAVDVRGILRYVDGESSLAGTPSTSTELPIQRSDADRRVREIFEQVRAARSLTSVLAEVFLFPSPKLPEGFGELPELHALWLLADSDPTTLVHRLPLPEQYDDFFRDWSETFRVDKLRTRATYRQRDLTGGGQSVRDLLERVMERAGAFEPRPPTPVIVVEVIEVSPEPEKATIELDPTELSSLQDRLQRLRGRKLEQLAGKCRTAAMESGAPQVELVRLWTGRADFSRQDLESPTRFDAHDARLYRGGSKRRPIGPGHRLWESLRSRVEPLSVPAENLSVDYEFSTGKIIALDGEREERDARFEIMQLLAGFLPDEDIARAVLLAKFDAEGGLRREAEFFAHAYTDRDGHAYEDITLGEVWSSDIELEVPDVDALAFIQKIWHDATVKPPLSRADHDKWYPRMSQALARIRHRRQVARSLASIWFDGRPPLEHGYDAGIDIMHALVAKSGENAARIGERLEEHGQLFMQQALKQIVSMGDDGWNAGNERRDALSAGRQEIRQAVLSVLSETGWLAN